MKYSILRVVPDFLDEENAHGFFTTFLFLSIWQKRMGHEVLVFSPGEANTLDEVNGIKVVRIRRRKFIPFVPLQLDLNKIIKLHYTEHPDRTLVHSHNRIALGASYTKPRPPHVVHLHGLPFAAFKELRHFSPPPSLRSFLYDLRVHNLYKIALKRAEAVIAYCKGLSMLLPREYGVPEEKTFVVPNGVDDAFLDCFKEKENQSIAEGSQDKTISFVGRLEPIKGVYQTLLAMPQVLKEHPQAKLQLIGSGNETAKETIRQIISALGIKESATLIDHVPHRTLTDHYLRSSVHVAPQLSGMGYPKTILESLACGTPVVTSANADTEEIVTKHNCGFVIDPTNPADIASKVNYLLANQGDAKKMGRNGHILISRDFTWRQCASRVGRVYETIFNSAS